jgi:Flp pilus assembly pilin Flp
MLRRFWNDESGFLVSAELVLVASIMLIGMIVGMAEIQWAVVGELDDIGNAVGSLNQSFQFSGFSSVKGVGRSGGSITVFGSIFIDFVEDCDHSQCMIGCDAPVPEGPRT